MHITASHDVRYCNALLAYSLAVSERGSCLHVLPFGHLTKWKQFDHALTYYVCEFIHHSFSGPS